MSAFQNIIQHSMPFLPSIQQIWQIAMTWVLTTSVSQHACNENEWDLWSLRLNSLTLFWKQASHTACMRDHELSEVRRISCKKREAKACHKIIVMLTGWLSLKVKLLSLKGMLRWSLLPAMTAGTTCGMLDSEKLTRQLHHEILKLRSCWPCESAGGDAKSCKTGDEAILGGAAFGPLSAWEDCTLCGLGGCTTATRLLTSLASLQT